MNKKYSEEERQSVIDRYVQGEAVQSIIKSTGISRTTVYKWINQSQSNSEQRVLSARMIRQLENKVERLEQKIEIIKKANC